MLDKLKYQMYKYYSGDPKRIQHFIKVHAFAGEIGRAEGLDAETQFILEAAAIVHDIGIKKAEEKFGKCSGKLQEQEGPAEAEKILSALGFERKIIDRICYLVAHHHTYGNIVGADYQILVEADFIVNMFEDNESPDCIKTVRDNIFKTQHGAKIYEEIYNLR